MVFLINLLIALLVGVLAKLIMDALAVEARLSLIIAILVGVLVFFMNPAAHI